MCETVGEKLTFFHIDFPGFYDNICKDIPLFPGQTQQEMLCVT